MRRWEEVITSSDLTHDSRFVKLLRALEKYTRSDTKSSWGIVLENSVTKLCKDSHHRA